MRDVVVAEVEQCLKQLGEEQQTGALRWTVPGQVIPQADVIPVQMYYINNK